MHLTGAKVWPWHTIGCMHFRAMRPVKCPHVQHDHPPVPRILSSIQVDITDTQLTMGEQVSFTRFLWCACHDRSEGSAFFSTRLAAELHISHSSGCKNDSQLQDDHEAGPVGASGHWPARPVPTTSSKCASSYQIYAYDASSHPISVWIVSHRYMQASISVYTDVKHQNRMRYHTAQCTSVYTDIEHKNRRYPVEYRRKNSHRSANTSCYPWSGMISYTMS